MQMRRDGPKFDTRKHHFDPAGREVHATREGAGCDRARLGLAINTPVIKGTLPDSMNPNPYSLYSVRLQTLIVFKILRKITYLFLFCIVTVVVVALCTRLLGGAVTTANYVT